MIRDLIIEARPWQYTKNLIIFAGLVFARHLLDSSYLTRSVVAFVAFCLLSSAIYVLNDLVDLERDRIHPRKKFRPIASGRVSRGAGMILFAFFVVSGAALTAWLGLEFAIAAVSFFVLNLAYSFFLKNLVVLDVMAIALSFEVRAIAGVEALKALDPAIEISPWLLVCTLFLALFLGFGKRRHELNLLKGEAAGHRATLGQYSERFLDTLIAVVTAATVLAYAIYTVAPDTVEKFHTTALVYSIPFVIYGIFRYLYLIFERQIGGSPSEILLTDPPLFLTILGWMAAVFAVVYLSGATA
jgi:4-hydroxybenzoate polyprenyltransferase